MKKHLILTTAAAATLALPASAVAHPGVFKVTAKIVPSGNTAPVYGDLTDQDQYAVLNDGYVIVLRDSNDLNTVTGAGEINNGMVNYKRLPNAFRNNTAVFPAKGDDWLKYDDAKTSLQVHATCSGVAAIEDIATIRSWQNDPFYGYVPWQKESAGIADDPAKWIPVVKAKTGIDLATTTDPKAACESKGGTYHAADTVVTSPANASSASIADAVKPVQTKLDAATAELAAAKSAAEATIAGLNAQLTQLKTPLVVAVDGTPSRTTGIKLNLTGPANTVVDTRAVLSFATAKKIKLATLNIGTVRSTVGADGKGTATLKLSTSAAKALKKATGKVAITVQSIGASRTATASSSL